jgi:lipid-A-disaccharide synthase-like uncharacterized protein
MSNWINLHPTIAVFLVVALCLVVGYMELKVLGRVDIPCLTWFIGVIIGTVALVGSDGSTVTRWICAAAFFFVGLCLILIYYKRFTSNKATEGRGKNASDGKGPTADSSVRR